MAVDRSDKRFTDIADAEFGERLKRLRHAAGLTRKRLSFESGVSERTIIKYESGKGKRAKDSTLLALCGALNATLDELLPPPKKAADAPARAIPERPAGRKHPSLRIFAAVAFVAVVIAAGIFIKEASGPQESPGPRVATGAGENLAPDFTAIQAGRFYAEGLENLKRLFRDEARESFRLALEHDSTHAMSYVMLLHPHIRGTQEESRRLVAKARENQARLSPCEKLFLDAMEALVERDNPRAVERLEDLVRTDPRQTEAYRVLAQLYTKEMDYPKAIGCLNAAVTADTTDGMSFNRLAYVYLELGKYDKALEAVSRYAKLSPAEPNPYDTYGDIMAGMGRTDEAIDWYLMALERKKDFFPALQNLGQMYIFGGDYKNAEKYCRALGKVEDPGARCRSSLYLACIPLFRGRLGEALARLDSCGAADEASGLACLPNAIVKAQVLYEIGEQEEALRVFEAAHAVFVDRGGNSVLGWPINYVRFLSGVNTAAARALLDSLKTKIDEAPDDQEFKYWFCRGWIELHEHNPDDAVASLTRAAPGTSAFYVRYQLGLAYLAARQFPQAAAALETALNTYTNDRVRFPLWSVKAHYYLGEALLEYGETERAQKEFARFLELWKDADYEFPEIAIAKKQVTELTMHRDISE